MDRLQQILSARNLKAAVCQAVPLEPGVDSQWIYSLRLYLGTVAARVRVHSNATPERFRAVLFEVPNMSVLSLVQNSYLSRHLENWDPLMISTLRTCLKAVIEGNRRSAAFPDSAQTVEAGIIETLAA